MDGADFFGYVMVVYVVMMIGCRESSFLFLFNSFSFLMNSQVKKRVIRFIFTEKTFVCLVFSIIFIFFHLQVRGNLAGIHQQLLSSPVHHFDLSNLPSNDAGKKLFSFITIVFTQNGIFLQVHIICLLMAAYPLTLIVKLDTTYKLSTYFC